MAVQYSMRWKNGYGSSGPFNQSYDYVVGPTSLKNNPDPGGCPPGSPYKSVTLVAANIPVSLVSGCGGYYSDLTLTRRDGLPDTGGDPPGGAPEQRAPNTGRPTAPRPLPGAVPSATPAPRPRPPFTNPGQPAKQPLPYIPTAPAPLAPGAAPLPPALQPPARPQVTPKKTPAPAKDKQPFGNRPPTSSPFDPQTAFEVGVALGRALGRSDRPAINSTDMEEIKNYLTVPERLRTGEIRPARTPVQNIIGAKVIDPLIDTIKEVVPTAPATTVNNCPPPPKFQCDYDSKNIAGKCDSIKTLLDQNLDVPYSASLEFAPCKDDDDQTPTVFNSTADGIPGIDAKLNILADAMNLIWAKVRCDKQPLISISDTWEIKKELNCGQLVIVTKRPGDKSSYRRNFSIPHPRVTDQDTAKAIFSTRRKYDRGNHLVTLILRDNSRIKLNVDSEPTGQSLMDWLVDSCLDRSYQETPPGQYRHTGNAGREIIECQVEIYSVAYYATGKKGEMPDWQFVIPE